MFFSDLNQVEQRKVFSLFIQESSFDSLREIVLNNNEDLDDKCVLFEVDLLNEISYFLEEIEEIDKSESFESIVSCLLKKLFYQLVGTQKSPGVLGDLFMKIFSEYEHYYIIYKEEL